MSATIAQLITQEASTQGVPPAIALAVAQQESGMQQWKPDGSLVMGGAGDTGVFQIIPSTAASLGVDPTDLYQNIQGGVSLLAQLFNKYGSWSAALSAYNSGKPTGDATYVNSVLNLAEGFGFSAPSSQPDAAVVSSDISTDGTGTIVDTSSGIFILGLVAGGLALAWWAVAD